MNRKRKDLKIVVLVIAVGLAVAMPAAASTPETTNAAVNRIADQLVENQIKEGSNAGAWPAQSPYPRGWFTGTMVAGLTEAYWMTCKTAYRDAAELGGQWILDNADTCNFFHDEAYALASLSEMACNPQDNTWRDALTQFFDCVRGQPDDPEDPEFGDLAGTEWYIAKIADELDPAYATFQVAYYTVAAHYVDDPDKGIWRAGLIDLLATVENASESPIMALGAATWALSLTGPMDDTPAFAGDSQWTGFGGATASDLSDLPPLLKSYIFHGPCILGKFDGHFYWLYLPQDEGDAGYTAPNVYGMMGLAAAMQTNPELDYRAEIDIVWRRTLNAIDVNGDVWYDAALGPGSSYDATYYAYAGELLQALSAAALPGDINRDDKVNPLDLKALAINWLSGDGCSTCSIADLTRDRQVNLADFAKLAEGWMLER